MLLPAEARPLIDALSPVFTRPTLHRFVILLGSAILTTGRRTVANLVRTAALLTKGHPTTYQRASPRPNGPNPTSPLNSLGRFWA